MRLAFILLLALSSFFSTAQAQQCRVNDIALKGIDNLADNSLASACRLQKEHYKCDVLQDELSGEDKKKIIQCDLKSINENKISNMSLNDCVFDGLKLTGTQLLELSQLPGKIAEAVVKGFHENQFCNASLDKKRELLIAFNISVEDSRFKLSEQFLGKWLEEASCSEIDKLLYSRYQNYQNVIMRERVAAINTGKKPVDLALEKDNGQNILTMLKDAFKAAQVRYECYTPKVKAEMICAGVTSLIADAALGAGLKSAVTKISAVVKSKKALGEINRAVNNGEKINIVDSSKLLASDRKRAATLALGRELSTQQERAILEAHEIGLKEGRGYFTYTPEDLRKKAKILKDAGLGEEERSLLMRSGITGQFSTEEAKKVFISSLEESMKFGDKKEKMALISRVEKIIQSLKSSSDPSVQANTARLLGEMTQAHNVRAAKGFYQMGLEKIKAIAEKDPTYFNRTKTLDNYLALASHAGDQAAVKKGMSVYVKQQFASEGKRMGWKNTAEAANGLFDSLENEIIHYKKLGAKGISNLEAIRRKQQALLEEFKYIDQSGRRARDVTADLNMFQNEN